MVEQRLHALRQHLGRWRAGPQCIWANSPTNWGVWADHPNTGGIKAYPNSTKWSRKRISALGTPSSDYNVTAPTSGVAFTSAYDVWSSGRDRNFAAVTRRDLFSRKAN